MVSPVDHLKLYGGVPPWPVALKLVVNGAVPVSGDPLAVALSPGGSAVTVTIAFFTIVPPLPVTVNVYVVVAVGETIFEPFRLTAPMPLSSDTEVASVVDQVSVDDEPVGIDAGVAENVAVGAGALTVTLALLVIVPPLPVTVRV